MLKDKIIELCQLNNTTIKKLSVDLEFSEPTFYRWFKSDSMEIKHLRKIADYFGKDIGFFFSITNGTGGENAIEKVTVRSYKEPETLTGVKDKYIVVLEENSRLQKEINELKDKLAQCSGQLERKGIHKQTG